jgi:hypothetical protein
VLPALLILLPVFALALGTPRALLHAALGLAGAIVVLEAVMVSYEKVPFTCTYLPSEGMKVLGPVYAVAFIVGASSFARMQYDALQGSGPFGAVITLIVLFVVLRILSATRARLPAVQFDESPVTFQRLGLDS